jgi:hypothetical protein
MTTDCPLGQILLEAAKKDFEERYGKADVPKRSAAAGLLTGAAKGAVSGAPKPPDQKEGAVSGAPKPPDQKEGDWQDVDAADAAASGVQPAAAAAAPDGGAAPAAPT